MRYLVVTVFKLKLLFSFFKKNSISCGEVVSHRGTLQELLPQSDIIFNVKTDGRRHYRSLTEQDLLRLNQDLITRIFSLMRCSESVFEQEIMPVILKFANTVGSLPASENYHDLESGGLFRHSLKTALKLLEMLDVERQPLGTELFYQDHPKKLMGFYLALTHDLGKCLSDVRVYIGQERWQPFSEALTSFVRRHKAESIDISFNRSRGQTHNDCLLIATALLEDTAYSVMQNILKDISAEEMLSIYYSLKPYLSKADSLAVADSCRSGKLAVCIPSFLLSEIVLSLQESVRKIQQRVQSASDVLDLKNIHWQPPYELLEDTCYSPDSSIYPVAEGCLVVKDSEFARNIKDTVDGITYASFSENNPGFTKDMYSQVKAREIYNLQGTHSLYFWSRITIGCDLLWVYAALASIPKIKNLQKTEWIPRGRDPFELREILKLEKYRNSCRIYIKGGASLTGILRAEDLARTEGAASLSNLRQSAEQSLKASAKSESRAEITDLLKIQMPAAVQSAISKRDSFSQETAALSNEVSACQNRQQTTSDRQTEKIFSFTAIDSIADTVSLPEQQLEKQRDELFADFFAK